MLGDITTDPFAPKNRLEGVAIERRRESGSSGVVRHLHIPWKRRTYQLPVRRSVRAIREDRGVEVWLVPSAVGSVEETTRVRCHVRLRKTAGGR